MLICEHASHFIPPAFNGLGLSDKDLLRHIAWDIGALGLAKAMAILLDAALVHANYSRLLLDINRPINANDSIVLQSENTVIPGNENLTAAEIKLRQEKIYNPFHAEVEALIEHRSQAGMNNVIVSIHSFTPNYHGSERPWHVGVISKNDRSLADALLHALSADEKLCVGDNLPYGPQDGVYHSIERHTEARSLRNSMIEVRNDLLVEQEGQQYWASILSNALRKALNSK